MKIIALFSIHRTGSNYLHSVLKQWPSLASFDEIFHHTHVYGLKPAHLEALSEVAGVEFRAKAKRVGSDFTQWARAHPLEVIRALQGVAEDEGRDALMFKVFNRQWIPTLDEVVEALAGHPGFTPIILKRRCIDTYVSFRKAEVHGKYKRVDTTNTPVDLDQAAYEPWAKSARNWYRDVDAALERHGKSPLRVTYERDIDMPPTELTAHWAALLGLVPGSAIDADVVVPKQDLSLNLFSKIANFDEFKSGLIARGLWDEAFQYFPGAITAAS